MKRTFSLRVLFGAIVLLIVFISSCTPTRISVEEYNRLHGIESEVPGDVQETPPSAEEPDQIETPKPVETQSHEIPDDIPVMEGATNLQVIRNASTILYQIDGSIEDVVAFYQETLPEHGWEIEGPADNVIGSIATMLRENAIDERLAINMQANEVGGFVSLTITVTRAQ